MNKQIDKIEKLIYTCFKEISEHAMQSEILSSHIREINGNLKSMLDLIDQINKKDSLQINTVTKNYSQREVKPNDEKEKILIVAYALSRFNHFIINDILKSKHNQSAVFNYLSHQLEVKVNTLKNYRDAFDPYVKQENSDRKGWYQKKLTPEFIAIKEILDRENRDLIKEKISKIIG